MSLPRCLETKVKISMNLQPVFADCPFVSISEKPVCDDLFARGVCLPSDTKMSMDDVDRVCAVIRGMF